VKSGNATDREKLSEASNCNKVRPNNTPMKKKAEKPLYPSRQRRRIEKQQGRTQGDNQSDDDNGEDAFGDAFRDGMANMTPHQAERDQEFKEQTEREIVDGQRAAVAHRQAVGDGVATDGSLLFVRHTTGLPCNYGDNSNIGRARYAAVLDSERKMPARKKPPPIAKTKPAQKRVAKKPAQKRPPPMAKRLPPSTTCAIKGCNFGTRLQADHKCYNKCGRVFHNLCAQMNDLCDNDNELDMYCSMECKRSKK
jgi:hypothetical protein